MSDRSKNKPGPQVQVIRRPASATPSDAPKPSAVAPRQAPERLAGPAPRPVAPRSNPSPTSPPSASAPRAVGSALSTPATGTGRPSSGPGRFSRPTGPREPRPPPTPDAIAALARKERVPNRIAKGELEGKMKCRIWKKLHREEAQRFDQAWTLIEATPGLELADAFGIVQSGLSVDDFRARRARAKKREAIKEARGAIAPEAIDAFIKTLIDSRAEVSVVMGERTVLDVLTGVAPISFSAERSGQLEKLHVVALATKTTWDEVLPGLDRDQKLSQRPAPVARQPARRPVSDPRPLLGLQGRPIQLQLRNGIKLTMPLLAVGPFDVLIGEPGREVFVPLHAMVSAPTAASEIPGNEIPGNEIPGNESEENEG